MEEREAVHVTEVMPAHQVVRLLLVLVVVLLLLLLLVVVLGSPGCIGLATSGLLGYFYGMTAFGHFLQIAGLIVAPLGLVHYFTTRHFIAESSLMTWELGLLALGAGFFLLGQRLSKKK